MIQLTIIKSPEGDGRPGDELAALAGQLLATGFAGKVALEVLLANQPEAQAYGIIATPVVAIGGRICSMGKPVSRDRLVAWLEKALGA